jgi:hypothetical protein
MWLNFIGFSFRFGLAYWVVERDNTTNPFAPLPHVRAVQLVFQKAQWLIPALLFRPLFCKVRAGGMVLLNVQIRSDDFPFQAPQTRGDLILGYQEGRARIKLR